MKYFISKDFRDADSKELIVNISHISFINSYPNFAEIHMLNGKVITISADECIGLKSKMEI